MSAENMQAQALAGNQSLVSAVASAELDQQIMTAKSYPRELKASLARCTAMVTLTQEVAESCMYSLPRDGHMIAGASVRFAEILVNAWQNCRVGGRVIEAGATHLTAQGVFHDLESNVAVTKEVRRRITKKSGVRYNDDMIVTAGNAAISIALRNAVLAGIPQALWNESFLKAKAAAVGKASSMVQLRTDALAYMAKLGAPTSLVLATLGVREVDLLTMDDLAVLRGLASRIKGGELVDSVMAPAEQSAGKATANVSSVAEKVATAAAGSSGGNDAAGSGSDETAEINTASEWPHRREDGLWYDSRGIPFDSRVHGVSAAGPPSVSKRTGQFTKRRGCDPKLHDQIERDALAVLSGAHGSSGGAPDQSPATEPVTYQPPSDVAPGGNATGGNGPGIGYPDIRSAISRAATQEACDEAEDMLRSFDGPDDQRAELEALLSDRSGRIQSLLGDE